MTETLDQTPGQSGAKSILSWCEEKGLELPLIVVGVTSTGAGFIARYDTFELTPSEFLAKTEQSNAEGDLLHFMVVDRHDVARVVHLGPAR
jgi:hypothetical protein